MCNTCEWIRHIVCAIFPHSLCTFRVRERFVWIVLVMSCSLSGLHRCTGIVGYERDAKIRLNFILKIYYATMKDCRTVGKQVGGIE